MWAGQVWWPSLLFVWLSAAVKLPSARVHRQMYLKQRKMEREIKRKQTSVAGDAIITVVYRWKVGIEHPDGLEGEEVRETAQVLLQPFSAVVCVVAADLVYRRQTCIKKNSKQRIKTLILMTAKPDVTLTEPKPIRGIEVCCCCCCC